MGVNKFLDNINPMVVESIKEQNRLSNTEMGMVINRIEYQAKKENSSNIITQIANTDGLLDYMTKSKNERFCERAISISDSLFNASAMEKACNEVMDTRDIQIKAGTMKP